MRSAVVGILAALLVFAAGLVPAARAEIQLPKSDRTNADEQAIEELEAFYAAIEEALGAEDIDRIMSYYADDYLHHGITKKQLRFMWLEIFSNFSDLYSVHIFSKIDVFGGDAILVCTGALLGIPSQGKDYEAVDRWVNLPHWLTKIDGEWRIIGGASQQAPARPGSGILELHPLF